jgi:2'-5' RNA ligase
MARLSIAVWPPPRIVAALASLDRPVLDGVRWSTPPQWMVKVRPLGTVNERLVPELAAVLDDELMGAPAVRCVLGPVTRWLGGQWLGAPVHGLEDLAAVVFEATEALVPVTHPQPFQADVVLARGRVPKDLTGRPISGRWTTRSVSLVADRSSVRAPRFEDLATIRLGAERRSPQ